MNRARPENAASQFVQQLELALGIQCRSKTKRHVAHAIECLDPPEAKFALEFDLEAGAWQTTRSASTRAGRLEALEQGPRAGSLMHVHQWAVRRQRAEALDESNHRSRQGESALVWRTHEDRAVFGRSVFDGGAV